MAALGQPLGEGSSPLTRGAPPAAPRSAQGPGIIPAYAGSTILSSAVPVALQDHPRLRGEHHSMTIGNRPSMGSSPLTRGAPQAGRGERLPAGIIPAYAGSTPMRVLRMRYPRDHPRLRGEHSCTKRIESGCWGSSPLTRGAPERRGCRPEPHGIIPAYAGSTGRDRRAMADW